MVDCARIPLSFYIFALIYLTSHANAYTFLGTKLCGGREFRSTIANTVYSDDPMASVYRKLNKGSHTLFRLCASKVAASNVTTDEPTLESKSSKIVDGGDNKKRSARTVVGHAHTDESRAKISAANKGKQPWNVGRQHSEETKRKIAEKTKAAMLHRKQTKADELGLTMEEYDQRNQKVKAEKKKTKLKGGLTEDGRKRISESQKKRWADPEYREKYSKLNRGTRNHTQETKLKLSIALKEKWQTEEYRNLPRLGPTKEVRAKISQTLKDKWLEPEFREKMMNSSFERTPEYRAAMSAKIRAKWNDPVYRSTVESSIRLHFQNNPRMRLSNGNNSSRRRSYRRNSVRMYSTEEIKERKRRAKQKSVAKATARREAFKEAKAASKLKARSSTFKEILGGQIWFEEKMRRTGVGEVLPDDATLEKALFDEFEADADEDEDEDGDDDDDDDDIFDEVLDIKKESKKRKKKFVQTEDDVGDGFEFIDDYGFNDALVPEFYIDGGSEEDDLIEVYDEEGELVGTYDIAEFQRIKEV